MAPNPQKLIKESVEETVSSRSGQDGETVVITGMSGLYPNSHNVKDLSDILYNKINPVTAEKPRWKYEHPDLPEQLGKIPELNTFDAQFFTVHYHLGNCMDPMSRKLLEQTYQAIYDAGVSPKQLSGKKVGVYLGTCFSESEKAAFYSTNIKSGIGIVGCSKAMYANRISYWLNLKGPSMSIDALCSSSMIALERAYEAINTGQCEAAIVGGASICLHPQSALHYGRNIPLCMDGKTKSFDANANGCARSEAINVLFLEKAKNAKRIYADVCYIKSKFMDISGDLGQIYGPYRNQDQFSLFLKELYDEVGIPPADVEYVEAFGAGTLNADKSELEAISNVFCKDRTKPLLVGSVMSNIGYTEGATGLSAITKVLLGYHTGRLAANLHCDNPRDDVEALKDGRMHVVNEHEHFDRTYVGVNNMSISGINVHALLHGHFKPKNLSKYQSSIPYLVSVSGRQESGVRKIITDLLSHPIDPEQIGLLHGIHEDSISGHLGRGFCILDVGKDNRTISLAGKIDYSDDAKKALWFVYSGMGSQWTGMGKELMRIPVFVAAIERCREVLEPKGVDIVDIITSTDQNMFNNVLHSFVGIAAIQIGLTNILRELGIVPDKIIGHSVGELGCAYADGCLTIEEMILSAYSRGLVSLNTPLIHGSMAAVGLGYQQIVKLCPPEIEVACHNSSESSTISGPSDKMKEFVETLTSNGIFAKEVPTSNIAYHSRYIKEAGPAMLKYLKEVIKSPKARSDRWVSTSVPQNLWDKPVAKFCSAEYHTNNLLSPVLFEETSKLIPSNAVVIEVAPHGLLQAILKRSLPSTCVNVPLIRRGHYDNVLHLLEAIGNLYIQGYNPKIKALYPKIEYPVSTGTPMLSHLVEWVHNENWSVSLYATASRRTAAATNFVISVHDDQYSYLRGNVHGDSTLYPFSGALVCVWDTLAMSVNAKRNQLSVQFQNVHFYEQPQLNDNMLLHLSVQLNKGNGYFEVMGNDTKIICGHIFSEQKNEKTLSSGTQAAVGIELSESAFEVALMEQDIYKLFYDRGSYYNGKFRSIKTSNDDMTWAQIAWTGNWVTLLDSMLQLITLRRDCDSFSLPRFLRRLDIDLQKITSCLTKTETTLEASVFKARGIKCGPVEMEDVIIRDLPSICPSSFALRELNTLQSSNIEDKQGRQMYVESKEVNIYNKCSVTLRSTEPGNLETLRWEEIPNIVQTKCPITVHYAGLNIRDAKRASGIEPKMWKEEDGYGMDYSGITESGERVMGLIRGGAASSRVAAEPSLLWPVPAHWTLEDAATVPLPYANALYCLAIRHEMRRGMSILVHGATGALGQAVISIALAHGCNVFATVSDVKKKHFLRKLFPNIRDDQIGNSRDHSFEDMVRSKTKGTGCDIVLNGLAGDLKHISLNCVAPSGVTLDTQQIPCNENFEFGMSQLTLSRNYIPIDLSSIFELNDNIQMKKIQLLLSDGIVKGYVRPLSRLVYQPQDTTQAFQVLTTSRHRGRILLQIQARMMSSQAIARINITNANSHLVITNTADDVFVTRLVNLLISRGAKYITLHCQPRHNHTTTNRYMEMKIKSWKNLGILIQISAIDLTGSGTVGKLVKYCSSQGPLESIFVLNCCPADEKQHLELTPIITELDSVSRNTCPLLRFFTVIAENSDIGQDICKNRKKDGLPATMIHIPKTKYRHNEYISVLEAVEQAIIEQCPSVQEQIQSSLTRNLRRHTADMTEESVGLITKETLGLNQLFSYVDPDELMGTLDIVFIPTATHSAAIRDDEFYTNETYLVIIPGLEGHHNKFHKLCERLKLPAVVLQPGLDRPNENVNEMATRMAKIMLTKLKTTKKFYLLGHSFGVLVALEIAAILEEKGLDGVVYCVDASPDTFPAALDSWLCEANATDETRLQDAIVHHICALMAGNASVHLQLELNRTQNWPDKVVAAVRALRGLVTHSSQYTQAYIETAFARIEQARRYNAQRLRKHPLRSLLVVLRSSYQATSVEPDLGLRRYSQRAPEVYNLNKDHAHAFDDLRCAAIVNRHLDKDILDAFHNKNLCETYLLNADVFINHQADDKNVL